LANYTVGVAAGTAILGYDLVGDQGVPWGRTGRNRVIATMALCGSAVIGDTEVDVYIGEVRIGNLFNTALLLPNKDEHVPVNAGVPANDPIRVIVRDAPATSIIYFQVSIFDA